jgi:hypothetical protein
MLLAYHNDPAIKSTLILQLAAHAEADQIVKGQYWQNGKGCAVACTIHSDDHSLYETTLGIPQMIARLEDTIFEGLPNRTAKAFPLRFANAITPGTDLSLVGPRFIHWTLTDEGIGLQDNAFDDGKIAIQGVAGLWARKIAGETVQQSEWDAARYAVQSARSAARYAAESAAESARFAESAHYAAESARYAAESVQSAWFAAWFAAWSAARSARYAAKSAAESAARSAESAESAEYARSDAYIAMADKLVELLSQAPVPIQGV